MEAIRPTIPDISASEKTPLVIALLEVIDWQENHIENLEQEILKFKGETTKPKIKPSKMDKETEPQQKQDPDANRKKPGPKRKKTPNLRIDTTEKIEPECIPAGSTFKGYREIIVQGLVIKSENICYRLAQYQTPDGYYLSGKLPTGIINGHWSAELVSFILYQYHQQHVTQPLLLEQLHQYGVDISSGQLSRLITHGLDDFHKEKDELFRMGVKVSNYLQTDDTSARHNGKNGYCTHIGNDLFAWFESTESKSRINFLKLLSCAVDRCYVINTGAKEYVAHQKLPKKLQNMIAGLNIQCNQESEWEEWLNSQGITAPRHRKILTEGALMGGLLSQGIPADMGIVSDDAGQFNIFDHALCWIHAERGINRLIPLDVDHKDAVNWAREQIWNIYGQLKHYKIHPSSAQAEYIRNQFMIICKTTTSYDALNKVLIRMADNADELLRVLDRPELPLHNNLSEQHIRDYAKKRKISGSTRANAGRRARDTFASLKKTCLKQGVPFWKYLIDRLSKAGKIPRLSELIHQTATCT
jgi:hypothetical protein